MSMSSGGTKRVAQKNTKAMDKTDFEALHSKSLEGKPKGEFLQKMQWTAGGGGPGVGPRR